MHCEPNSVVRYGEWWCSLHFRLYIYMAQLEILSMTPSRDTMLCNRLTDLLHQLDLPILICGLPLVIPAHPLMFMSKIPHTMYHVASISGPPLPTCAPCLDTLRSVTARQPMQLRTLINHMRCLFAFISWLATGRRENQRGACDTATS